MEKTNIIKKIENQTFSHLANKDYLFKTQKRDKYSKKLIEGQFYEPVEARKVFLTLAFNMALENYRVLRHGKPYNYIFNDKEEEEMDKTYSRFDCHPRLLHYIMQRDSHNELKLDILEGNFERLDKFLKFEPKLFKFIELMRNYHSHYIHEPGVIKFDDLFDFKSYENKKGITDSDFEEVKTFLEEKFTQAKEHKIKTLYEQLVKVKDNIKNFETYKINNNTSRKELFSKENQIEKVLDIINSYEFFNSKTKEISEDVQLMIASMFLRNSQAETILQKWSATKKKDGYFKSLEHFYSYYSIKDSHTLTESHPQMAEFRKILSHLSAIPEVPNENFIPLYELIKSKNKSLFIKVEPLRNKLNLLKMKFGNTITSQNEKDKIQPELEKLNKQINEITRSIIPLRKKNVVAPILMRYLEDNGLLENFEIACKKQPIDIIRKETGENIVVIKEEMSNAKGEDKRKLTAKYREINRNFTFKKPGETHYKYTLRENNVILKYNFPNSDEFIQVVVSQEILLKLCFLHFKDIDIKNEIDNIIRLITHFYYITKPKYDENKINIKNTQVVIDSYSSKILPVEKVFPKSFFKAPNDKEADELFNENLLENVKKKIAQRIDELEELEQLSRQQDKPWQYASKKKIDWVLDYAHFKFLCDAYNQKKSDDDIRHTALNANEHNQAYQFIRFFGKERERSEFYEFFNKTHKEYFAFLLPYLIKNKRLEDLYTSISNAYINDLKSLTRDINQQNNIDRIFGVTKPTSETSINNHLHLSAYKSIALAPEIISISKHFPKIVELLTNEKLNKGMKNENINISDMNIMRYNLEKEGNNDIKTNSDFVLSKLLPKVLKKEEKATQYLRTFLKQKTYDLMLWQIGKKYFTQANGNIPPQWDLKFKDSEHFQEYNIFYKIYDQPINVPITDGSKLKLIISPRKMDDEYLYPEISKRENANELKRFFKNDEPRDFVELIKEVKNELKFSFQDIGLVLSAEKIIIDNAIIKSKDLINEKYNKIGKIEDDRISDYYLDFGSKKPKSYKMIVDLFPDPIGFTKTDLLNFRNNAMHYQLQDKKHYFEIRKYLTNIVHQKHIDYKLDRQPKPSNKKKKKWDNNKAKNGIFIKKIDWKK